MNHPRAAASFLADAPRAAWHDRAVWSVRRRRDEAARQVPEWEELRRLAEQIRAHALDHLGRYLREFEDNARRRGAQVHFAADAAEHNRIVHALLAERGATRVVKSKSMLTEECGLNPYLESRGVRVIDTDLGERIVQLRREAPSHIVMPAIHLRTEDVGELFACHLGTEPGLADPVRLVEAARRHLRAEFLQAQAGITGVNFAVAETGGLVVVTNEGNADLGAALPDLHIACMGIDKVIARAADLGVLLRLLARSATGQALTAYTSHFHGPRPGGELHIVIVDNGRTDLLRRGAVSRALRCIRCGACLNTCPVYRRSGGHSYGVTVAGPIGSILAAARDPARHASLPDACSVCGSCSDVCPVRIDLHHQLVRLRGDLLQSRAAPLRKRMLAAALGWLVRDPRRLRVAGFVLRRVAPRALLRSRLNPWTRARDLPDLPRRTFHELLAERRRG